MEIMIIKQIPPFFFETPCMLNIKSVSSYTISYWNSDTVLDSIPDSVPDSIPDSILDSVSDSILDYVSETNSSFLDRIQIQQIFTFFKSAV